MLESQRERAATSAAVSEYHTLLAEHVKAELIPPPDASALWEVWADRLARDALGRGAALGACERRSTFDSHVAALRVRAAEDWQALRCEKLQAHGGGGGAAAAAARWGGAVALF